MAVRDHTLADFDRPSRRFESKVEIYFTPGVATTFYDSDYLVAFDILEEMCAEDATPAGALSAGTLSVSLYNKDYRFSPENISGPYYGSLVAGIKVKPFIRLIGVYNTDVPPTLDTLNWISLGVFFTTDWQGNISNDIKVLKAEDSISLVISSLTNNDNVIVDTTFKAAYEYFLDTYLVDAAYSVNALLGSVTLPVCFTLLNDDVGKVLKELMVGSMSCCYCDRSADVTVNPLIMDRTNKHTLTDANTIIDIETTQSIVKSADGVNLTYSVPSLNKDTKLLSISEYKVPVGTVANSSININNGPVVAISYAGLQTKVEQPYVSLFSYKPWKVSLTTVNAAASELTAILDIYGTNVSFIGTQLFDETKKPLVVTSKYIQAASQASSVKSLLNDYVDCAVPYITINTRGNLLLHLNDLVTVDSVSTDVNVSGVIIRQSIKYDGDLTADITLINAEILGGV